MASGAVPARREQRTASVQMIPGVRFRRAHAFLSDNTPIQGRAESSMRTLVGCLLAALSTPLWACTPITGLPVTLSSPGHYCLTNDLNFAGTGDAVTVTASGVTIDLRGYALSSNGSASNSAIRVSAVSNVNVRNGQIHSVARGVQCVDAHNVEVEGVHFQAVSHAVLANACSYLLVRNNRVFDSLSTAILIGGSTANTPEFVATVRGNEIAAVGGVYTASTALVYAIQSETAASIIDHNYIAGVRGAAGSAAIRAGGGSLVSDNLIVSAASTVSCVAGSPSEKSTRNVTENGASGYTNCLSQDNF